MTEQEDVVKYLRRRLAECAGEDRITLTPALVRAIITLLATQEPSR